MNHNFKLDKTSWKEVIKAEGQDTHRGIFNFKKFKKTWKMKKINNSINILMVVLACLVSNQVAGFYIHEEVQGKLNGFKNCPLRLNIFK